MDEPGVITVKEALEISRKDKILCDLYAQHRASKSYEDCFLIGTAINTRINELNKAHGMDVMSFLNQTYNPLTTALENESQYPESEIPLHQLILLS